MIYKFLFLSAVSLFFVQGNGLDITQSLSEIKQLTSNAAKNISAIAIRVNNATAVLDEMMGNRRSRLDYQYNCLKNSLNETIIETVLKGMSKNKQYSVFQCISFAGGEYLNKTSWTFSKVPDECSQIKSDCGDAVKPFGLLIPGFYHFLEDLYLEKEEELKKCQNENDVNKVLEETSEKIKNLNSVLKNIDSKIEEIVFKFFSDFISFISGTEKSLRKLFNDGNQKVISCIKR